MASLPVKQFSLYRIVTAIVLLVAAVGLIASSVSRALEQERSVDATNGTGTFHFEMQPAYMLYPGQEITLRWVVGGIENLYLNDSGKIGEYEEVHTVDQCTSFVWTGTTQDGKSYTYTLKPTNILHDDSVLASIGIGAVLLLLAGAIHPQPVMRRLIDGNRALLHWRSPEREPALYRLIVLLVGIIAMLILTIIGDRYSCFTPGTEITSSQRNIYYLYIGVIIGSVISFTLGLIRPIWSRFWPIAQIYLIVIGLSFIWGTWQSWGWIEQISLGWLLVSTLAIMSIIFLSRKHPTSFVISQQLFFSTVLCAIVLNLVLFPVRPLPLRPTFQLRNLYFDQYKLMDLYELVRQNYSYQDLQVNLPDSFKAFEAVFRRLHVWGTMQNIHYQNRPDLYLSSMEIDALLELSIVETQIPNLDFYLVIPDSDTAGPILLTHFDIDKIIMIPFEQIPERIKAAWETN